MDNTTVPIQGGEYMHIGLELVLTAFMDEYSHANKLTVDHSTLSLNVDGLPISRPSTQCLWSILISDDIIKSIQIWLEFSKTSVKIIYGKWVIWINCGHSVTYTS